MKRKSTALYTVRVPLLVSKEQYRRLLELSNSNNLSVCAIVRRMIDITLPLASIPTTPEAK